MAQTLAQITKQIEKLQKEADALRHAELKGVVDRIKVAIAHYGLTPDQLGFGKPAVKNAKPAKAVAKSDNKTAAPRFANDEGQVWSGRGPRPRWLREALAVGRSLDEFSTDARKRTSTASPEPKPRNVGAVVVPPAKTNVAAKRAKASTKQTEMAALPAPSPSDAAAARTASAVAPQGPRGATSRVAKPASAKKASATNATPVSAKRAPQVKAKRANRVVAASSKGTTGVSAEKSSPAAPASAAA